MHGTLRRIRFEPRPSLEAEVLWRVRRGREGREDRAEGLSRGALPALAAIAVAIVVVLFWLRALGITHRPG